MKLKKILASILGIAMVLSTIGITVQASEETGRLSAYLDSYRIWGDLDASADESVVVKVYSEDTIIVTSTLKDKSHLDGDIKGLT